MNENTVYLGEDGILRIIWVGEQNEASSREMMEEALRIAGASDRRKVLFDTTRAGKFSIEGRKPAARCLAAHSKVAIVASSTPMRALGLFMVGEARGQQAKVFERQREALDWLAEPTRGERWGIALRRLWRAILRVRWLRVKERWLKEVFDVLSSVAVGDFSRRVRVSKHTDELALIEAGINLMVDDLQDREKEAREYERRLREERSRLARELHDSVSQLLFSVVLNSEAAGTVVESDPQLARRRIDSLQTAAREAQKQMRELLTELGVGALEGGLSRALKTHVSSFREREAIETTFSVEGEKPLAASMERELYRIAQEALNNIAKHSQATSASVALEFRPGLVRLRVEDDGIGFDPSRSAAGLGLRNMRERAEGIGGRLAIESAPGKGTRVAVEVPLEEGNG